MLLTTRCPTRALCVEVTFLWNEGRSFDKASVAHHYRQNSWSRTEDWGGNKADESETGGTRKTGRSATGVRAVGKSRIQGGWQVEKPFPLSQEYITLWTKKMLTLLHTFKFSDSSSGQRSFRLDLNCWGAKLQHPPELNTYYCTAHFNYSLVKM